MTTFALASQKFDGQADSHSKNKRFFRNGNGWRIVSSESSRKEMSCILESKFSLGEENQLNGSVIAV
jgi:hypothetical protein